MKIKQINSNNAPAAIGPYSQGISAGSFIFLSGQIPIDALTGEVVGNDIASQTKQVFKNINSILAEAGIDFLNIVKTTVFLKDLSDFILFNKVYEKYFKSPFPARSCIEVSGLPKDVLVEVEVIAIK